MTACLFVPPSGDPRWCPDLDFIEAVLLNPDPCYWENGSGDAGLHEDGTENMLVFDFVRDRGFCVIYETSTKPWVLLGDGSLEKAEVIFPGGTLMTVPLSYFVPAERALEAAKEFLNAGSPLGLGVWVEFNAEI